MTDEGARRTIVEYREIIADVRLRSALDMAIKALEKQIELRENCEGSCIDCKYRGEFHCANDLLIDSEV